MNRLSDSIIHCVHSKPNGCDNHQTRRSGHHQEGDRRTPLTARPSEPMLVFAPTAVSKILDAWGGELKAPELMSARQRAFGYFFRTYQRRLSSSVKTAELDRDCRWRVRRVADCVDSPHRWR
jgi:hypothetical protein